jgi:tRNA threonylcarbamoyladenosine biosynthesis protein TsaE
MSILKLDITEIDSLKKAAEELIKFSENETVFLFDAEMGNGKTTFIKAICSNLGVIDTMSSPTYSIVNEYKTINGKVFHFDLYRINSIEELYDLGFEEYFDDKNRVFIEWPAFVAPFVKSYIDIKIKIEGNNRYLYAQILSNHE